MSANYKQLADFTKKIEKLNNQQKEEFLESCCKELAARLLAKVIKRTPVGDYSKEVTVVAKRDSKKHKKGETYTKKVSTKSGGTLRRGWTAKTQEEAASSNGKGKNASEYANSLEIKKIGDKFHIDITNPVEYASYVEYGHRTKNHGGWVEGHHMLTISEAELNSMSDAILQKKLNKFMKDVFG